jgi:hypothetical protein
MAGEHQTYEGTEDAAPTGVDSLLAEAWGIIANASGGDWSREVKEWGVAALRWRDDYHAYLDRQREAAEFASLMDDTEDD